MSHVGVSSSNSETPIAGYFVGSHPAWPGEYLTPYVWLNVDVFGTDGAVYLGRIYNDDTLIHEVFHLLGLMHTFDLELGCDVNLKKINKQLLMINCSF